MTKIRVLLYIYKSELQKFTNEKMTVHKLKQRVKQLGEPISSKRTPTPKTPTKSKRSTVVELDGDDDGDDDDNVRAIYAARFDQLGSQI